MAAPEQRCEFEPTPSVEEKASVLATRPGKMNAAAFFRHAVQAFPYNPWTNGHAERMNRTIKPH